MEWFQCRHWKQRCGEYVEATRTIHESPFFSELCLDSGLCSWTVHKSSCSEIHVHSYNFVSLHWRGSFSQGHDFILVVVFIFFKHTASGLSACWVVVNRGLEYCIQLCWYRPTDSLGLPERTIANLNVTPGIFSNVSSGNWGFTP